MNIIVVCEVTPYSLVEHYRFVRGKNGIVTGFALDIQRNRVQFSVWQGLSVPTNLRKNGK
jgi:hypothetical protein